MTAEPQEVHHSRTPRPHTPARKAADPQGQTQALRTERTRNALLQSAERIFIRDGFEASRIEDIAADAGRSRGAFYANFENKTELFLALRDQQMQKHVVEMRERIQHLPNEEERRHEAHAFVAERLFDPQVFLLQIEFKLFALRRPEMRSELAAKHLDISSQHKMKELVPFFPETSKTIPEMQRHMLAVDALLEGFALNLYFSPELLDRSQIQRLLPALMETIFHFCTGEECADSQRISSSPSAAAVAEPSV